MNRRNFLGHSLAVTALAASTRSRMQGQGIRDPQSLAEIAERPTLEQQYLKEPIVIDSVELLHRDRNYFVRLRTRDGLVSVTTPNSSKMRDVYPIFLNRIAPYFVGKNACEIESLLRQLYRHSSNYKFQGLAFWVCQAAVEMGILDLIGQRNSVPIGALFGPIRQRKIAVYRASSNRGNTPEEEIDVLSRFISETGASALKIRLGGRMSRNVDSLPGRTEKLIALVRQSFGPAMTLYADSNSSYDAKNAVRIGRILEEHQYAFFEEPVPFDHLWDTKHVTDQLSIPVAGGEQEFSMRRFRWTIENRVVDIVQPDLHYFGGYIRCVKVARMAAARGLQCTPHMSGSGLGYVNALHFASFVPNVGPHQEFKGETTIPCHCPSSTLKCQNGYVTCPTEPGMGVTIDPDYLTGARTISG